MSYAEHVPAIANGMRAELETFKRGALFALLSIRQPVTNVPAQLDDVDRERSESAYLFGSKRAGYRHLELHGRSLWERVCALPLADAAEAIYLLTEMPGLGVVKAGFVAQMMGFDVACLDSRNVAREGRSARAYRTDRLSRAGVRRLATKYVADTGGRAEEYWNAWCKDVAPFHKMTAHAISSLHLAILSDSFVPF